MTAIGKHNTTPQSLVCWRVWIVNLRHCQVKALSARLKPDASTAGNDASVPHTLNFWRLGKAWGRGQMMKLIRRFVRNQRAATAIEYGLIAALIAMAAVGAIGTIGGKLSTTFNNTSSSFK